MRCALGGRSGKRCQDLRGALSASGPQTRYDDWERSMPVGVYMVPRSSAPQRQTVSEWGMCDIFAQAGLVSRACMLVRCGDLIGDPTEEGGGVQNRPGALEENLEGGQMH
jgi:hypothetical protein